MDHNQVHAYISAHSTKVAAVVDFDKAADRLLPFDFTTNNRNLSPETVADTTEFSKWISDQLQLNNCRYGIGGYNEHRTLYARSSHFDGPDEPRRLHLGVDIWGPVGTPVYNPLEGKIHSFKFNDNYGDYGATIIVEHDLDGTILHSLFGHLNLKSLEGLEVGQSIRKGQNIACFGDLNENGHWPPHLHLQLILDMQGMKGDYPGVCRYSERDRFLKNCPDPSIILQQTFN